MKYELKVSEHILSRKRTHGGAQEFFENLNLGKNRTFDRKRTISKTQKMDGNNYKTYKITLVIR